MGRLEDTGFVSEGQECTIGGCAIRHMSIVMRLLFAAWKQVAGVTRWGLFLRRGRHHFFGSVAYGKAASSCSQKSCQRDQTRRCEVGCRRSENVEAPGSLGMASNDDTSINRVKHLGLHDLEMSMAGQ